jgi:hypothetical protein
VRRFGAAVPQELAVRFADGSTETVRWDGTQSWQRFAWVKPARAVSARIDPQGRHYLDVSKLDDGRTLDADRAATRRWTFDAAALFQTLLALIANL